MIFIKKLASLLERPFLYLIYLIPILHEEKTVIKDKSLTAGNLICNLPRVLTEHHFDKPYISNLKTTPERVHLWKHKNILKTAE